MLDLMLLLTTEPPAVQLRGDAPAVVDWPSGYQAMRGDDAKGLARTLEIDNPDDVISAEPHLSHFGQLQAVTLHRAPSPTESSLFCRPRATVVSVGGVDSPDYPGWLSREEAERVRAAGQIADREPIFVIPLDADETCDQIDPAFRVARSSDEASLSRAIGLLNQIRRSVALGDFPISTCGPAPCNDPTSLLETLTPSQIELVYAAPSEGVDCWRIIFRTRAGDYGGWTMYICGPNPAAARIVSEPRLG